MQVNILDAKNRLSQLVKSVQAGEEVIIANRGTPVARLVSVSPPPAAMAGVAAWLAAHPLPAHAHRTGSVIDAELDRERAAWD